MPDLTRRKLFRTALAGGSAAALLSAKGALAETPRQPEGPFHPTDIGTDLLRKGPGAPMAGGHVIHLSGTVRAESGQVIPGALIELWQADQHGKYNHPSDPLDLTPDPDFQFWGRAVTDANGTYSFRSIKPGSYPASPTWIRPPHLHMKIARRGYYELITQMYFAGEALNSDDNLRNQLTSAEQTEVTVAFNPINFQTKPGQNDLAGTFDIELRAVPKEPVFP